MLGLGHLVFAHVLHKMPPVCSVHNVTGILATLRWCSDRPRLQISLCTIAAVNTELKPGVFCALCHHVRELLSHVMKQFRNAAKLVRVHGDRGNTTVIHTLLLCAGLRCTHPQVLEHHLGALAPFHLSHTAASAHSLTSQHRCKKPPNKTILWWLYEQTLLWYFILLRWVEDIGRHSLGGKFVPYKDDECWMQETRMS